MNDTIPLIEDLYRYNDWANGRVLELCDGLTNAQLDEPREMGFGTLRNTIFHILTAEQIWLERWQIVPWRKFPTDSLGLPIDEMQAQLRQISQARFQMMQAERKEKWKRIVNYKDSRGNEYSNPLDVLLLHVANHSAYHRAQALAYLKPFGRTLPVGLDFLLYKLARPTLEQPADSVTKFKAMGLQTSLNPGWNSKWDGELMSRFFQYNIWATKQILNLLVDADNATLERDFHMGHGSILKSLQHMAEVEAGWLKMLGVEPAEATASDSPIVSLTSRFDAYDKNWMNLVSQMTDDEAQKSFTSTPGGMAFNVRKIEALVQICFHGTHHRAQLVNMLRQVGRPVPASDLIAWWREQS